MNEERQMAALAEEIIGEIHDGFVEALKRANPILQPLPREAFEPVIAAWFAPPQITRWRAFWMRFW